MMNLQYLGIIPGQIIMGKIVDGACDYAGEPLKGGGLSQPEVCPGVSTMSGPLGLPPGAPPGPPGGPQCIRYDQHKLAVRITVFSKDFFYLIVSKISRYGTVIILIFVHTNILPPSPKLVHINIRPY